jgi:hypothetical protein
MDFKYGEQGTGCRHYSKDLKDCIMYQYTVVGLKPTQIALNLDMSIWVVQQTLQLWQEIGVVVRDPMKYNKQGRPMLINDTACNIGALTKLYISFLYTFYNT